MKKLRDRLNNPFLLVGQGFAFGALLFFATQPHPSQASGGAAPIAAPIEAAR